MPVSGGSPTVGGMTRPQLATPRTVRLISADDHGVAPLPDTPSDQPSSGLDGAGRHDRLASSIALAIPLILVNSAAIYGQAGWAYEHLVQSVILAGLFAASLESIGVYLSMEAHAALMAGDASLRLRLGSYAVAALVGTLNYWHFSIDWQPTSLAVTFGALSSISPWLWAIRSRSISRDRLRTLGLIDPRAVRFSPLRWLLHIGRTWTAFRAAVWAGVVDPIAAIALADAQDDQDEELLRIAWLEAGRILGSGRTITRDTLAAAIRSRGKKISNSRAGKLAREITADQATPAALEEL